MNKLVVDSEGIDWLKNLHHHWNQWFEYLHYLFDQYYPQTMMNSLELVIDDEKKTTTTTKKKKKKNLERNESIKNRIIYSKKFTC
jgi:hypothetical protein